jgi:hypothetical protein
MGAVCVVQFLGLLAPFVFGFMAGTIPRPRIKKSGFRCPKISQTICKNLPKIAQISQIKKLTKNCLFSEVSLMFSVRYAPSVIIISIS